MLGRVTIPRGKRIAGVAPGNSRGDITTHSLVSPVGRLKCRALEWEHIGAKPYVMNVIAEGYKLPFTEIPQHVLLSNNKTSKQNPTFVEGEIHNLLTKVCI